MLSDFNQDIYESSYRAFCSITKSHVLVHGLAWTLLVHGLQHARLPCPSPSSPWVCSDSCPLSQWCHPTISSSLVPSPPAFLQSFPASGSFPMSWLFTSGGQSIGASASASVLPMNIQGWFPLGLVWSPGSPRDSQESSPTPQMKSINSSALSMWIISQWSFSFSKNIFYLII